MAVDKFVGAGTPVITAEGVQGKVLRSYPGTSVVTIETVDGARLSMLRHELNYAPTHKHVDGWDELSLGDYGG